MASLTDKLRELHNEDPDVARVVDAFEEIDRIYQAALRAMGMGDKPVSFVGSTAEMSVSFTRPFPASLSKEE